MSKRNGAVATATVCLTPCTCGAKKYDSPKVRLNRVDRSEGIPGHFEIECPACGKLSAMCGTIPMAEASWNKINAPG